MGKINAVITGIGGYVPDYVLNNEELSRMVDTSDEWIMTRVGIKERHILTEEGLGTSYMARKAAKQLIKKTGVDPDTIDALIDLGLMTDKELQWLNDYHETVRQRLTPLIKDGAVKEWLADATKPISR